MGRAADGMDLAQRLRRPIAENPGRSAPRSGTPVALCRGNIAYAGICRDGTFRIFHLEPLGLPQEGPEYQIRQRAEATTVALTPALKQTWEISQHTGYRNRAPGPKETGWAHELLDRWDRAAADELLRDLRQAGNGKKK